MKFGRAAAAAACCACLCAGQALAAVPGQPDAVWTPSSTTVLVNVLANDGNIGKIRSVALTKPLHGKVRWVSGRVEYTPTAGYAGSDSFRYSVLGTAGRAANQRVTVTVGGPNAVTLQGLASDAPLANAKVTANVGIAQFQATADANGNYSLPVAGSGGTMVQLDAAGTGAQSKILLRSTVGGIDLLRSQAGDGVLTRDENNQVQVTQLSTAQSYLLFQANGGQDIATQAELDLVSGALNMGELLQMAAAIKLIADGAYPLPQGISNTYALISNPDALAQFIAAVNTDDPNALNQASQETVSDPAIVVPTDQGDFAGVTYLVYELGAVGTVSTGYIQGARMQIDGGGTGSWLQTVVNSDPSVSWSFSAGTLTVVPNHPVSTVSYIFVNGAQVQRVDTDTSYAISKLYEGGDRDIYATTTHSNTHYPGGEFPDESTAYSSTLNAIQDGVGILPYTSGELIAAPRAFAITGQTTPNGSGAAFYQFNGNGTGQVGNDHFSGNFVWSLNPDGSVQVTYPGGDSTSYVRIGNDGGHADAVLAVFQTLAGSAATFGASYVSDGSNGFPDAASLAHRWLSGFSISSTNSSDFGLFYIDLSGPGQTGSNSGFPLSWQVVGGSNGDMLYSQYWSSANGYVPFCTPIQVGVCEMYRARRWIKIAQDGNRIYILEELYADGNNGTYDGNTTSDEMAAQRLNFYEIAD